MYVCLHTPVKGNSPEVNTILSKTLVLGVLLGFLQGPLVSLTLRDCFSVNYLAI